MLHLRGRHRLLLLTLGLFAFVFRCEVRIQHCIDLGLLSLSEPFSLVFNKFGLHLDVNILIEEEAPLTEYLEQSTGYLQP